ncbi:hypothetical protein LUZ63_014784 [Rhynchospora breviuscula]|uniref:Apyrase n=1 Tax=Rhynchospora breviuscula TaxID=2022672 RepID=A0A9Q0HLS9_9POAL|nr:hypothetical protein LUZ63_014784 [Rhynchospora breviuscula]
MRLSASLEELPTYSTSDPLERESDPTRPLRPLQRDGPASSFSKERSSPRTPTKRKKFIRATVCILSLASFFILFYFFSGYFSNLFSGGSSEYSVILDCGSTGTRVYVYEWSVVKSEKGRPNFPIAIRSLPETPLKPTNLKSGRAYQRMETEPGFDKLVRNESGLRSAINPLLSWAEKQIPQHAHRKTPVFLYATGGVRKLPVPDSDWILNKAWGILKNSSFSCTRDHVKTITGMEEAYYGWIALNHHKGMLANPNPNSISTFGSLDLGGSSLQVTFETEKPIQDDTRVTLRIGSVTHQLTAYSLSGYGLNDAFDKSVAHLVKTLGSVNQAGGKVQIKHPCLHTGYKEDYSCSYCNPVKGQGGIAVELIGSPNWDECAALAKISINRSNWDNSTSGGVDCKSQPCALTDNLPRPNGHFYAISGFYVVFKFFNLTPDATFTEVLEKGRDFCAKPWDVAKASVVPQPFIEQYCFRAPYITSLLREGLQIEDSQVVIGSGSVTWTLGVAILEAGQALSSRFDLQGYNRLLESPHWVWVLFFLSVVLVVCAALCVGNWLPRSFRKPLYYLPLFRQNSASGSVRSAVINPFKLHLWSPISSGEKLPLSPTIAGSGPHPFGTAHSLSGTVPLTELSNLSGVSHSYSAGSLGQMQYAINGNWKPSRGQTTLQSRRTPSREDLSTSLADVHLAKV